jgi:hypothetical protein
MTAPDKVHAPFITKEAINPKSPHCKKTGDPPYRRLIIGYRMVLMDFHEPAAHPKRRAVG